MVKISLLAADGGLLCFSIAVIVVPTLFWKPRIWLRDLPQDIQAAADPITADEKRIAVAVGVLVTAIMLGIIVASTVRHGFAGGFVPAALHAFLLFQIFNAFDAVVLDCGILALIDPAHPPIEGTEDAADWRDYKYHFSASLRGAVIGVILAPAAAGAAWLISLAM
ncbi:MAG: hypothetical protein AAF753_11795 [Pseudomonadota bacterium]